MLAEALTMLSLVATAVSAAAVAPRDNWGPPSLCCFTIAEAGSGSPAQFDVGDLLGNVILGVSGRPDGWFCLDLSSPKKILYGNGDNACIEAAPDSRFSCLDPTPGRDQYTLQAGPDGHTLLSVNGGLDYKACPNPHGAGEMVYGAARSEAGCRTLQFVAKSLTGTCPGFTG
ncbi:F-box domain-containing protein [Purpureocillium lavendulum]|uniref:F-box domain-containing protein n=1 Tax=Purpureocillium lavendulum TaxID=1247861 RepID=A0AB34FN06_9HYPO|nr:F-box domain-containing protein [Purpureocillium lavendulum]